jgi:hypothetical protein
LLFACSVFPVSQSFSDHHVYHGPADDHPRSCQYSGYDWHSIVVHTAGAADMAQLEDQKDRRAPWDHDVSVCIVSDQRRMIGIQVADRARCCSIRCICYRAGKLFFAATLGRCSRARTSTFRSRSNPKSSAVCRW